MSGSSADLRIDQLARLTGLSPVLIRAWERRYGVPAASRTEGGHRRYTQEQAHLLRRAALLVRSGFRAADAIARAQSETPLAVAGDPAEASRLAELLAGGDVVPALDHLRAAWQTIGLDATLEDLVVPALHEIGEGWASGRYSIAEEHVATGVVMSWLGAVRAELPARKLGAVRYLLATPEGEEHAVAVWALELLLRVRGVPSLCLGASVPVADLLAHARHAQVAAVVLSISRGALRRTVAELTRELAGDGIAVYVGGPGARSGLPEGARPAPDTLTETANLLR